MPNTDDLYAAVMDDSRVVHGECAEEHWPDGLPADVTPVFYGDPWRGEVDGTCAHCGERVEPRAL